MSQSILATNLKSLVKGSEGISSIPKFTEAPIRNQLMLLCRDFGYKEHEISLGFNISEDEVKKGLAEIDPEGKIRVSISQKLNRWKDIRRQAESLINKNRMDQDCSSKELIQIALLAGVEEEKIEEKMQKSTKLLLPEDLKNNILNLLPEGSERK